MRKFRVKPDAKESTEETKESKTETKQVPAINSKMKAAPTSIQLPHPPPGKLFYTLGMGLFGNDGKTLSAEEVQALMRGANNWSWFVNILLLASKIWAYVVSSSQAVLASCK